MGVREGEGGQVVRSDTFIWSYLINSNAVGPIWKLFMQDDNDLMEEFDEVERLINEFDSRLSSMNDEEVWLAGRHLYKYLLASSDEEEEEEDGNELDSSSLLSWEEERTDG